MITYGFYDSKDHDRTYSAIQMSSIFDGIIEDGVYSNIGEFLATVPGDGMRVIVKTGRAWFDHTWTLNDSYLPLDIDNSSPLQTRVDAVVLEVDSRIERRENTIKIVKGIPSVNSVKPTLIHEDGVYQHPLAYITVPPNTSYISAQNIEIVVGKSECPFVQAPLQTVSIDDLWQQWDEQFNEWFDNLKATMNDNVVTNLQRQIDEKVNISDKATDENIKNGTSNKWVDANALKKNVVQPNSIVSSTEDLSTKNPNKYLSLNGEIVDEDKIPEQLRSDVVCNFQAPYPIENLNGSFQPSNINSVRGPLSIGDSDFIFTDSLSLTVYNRKTKTKIVKTFTTSDFDNKNFSMTNAQAIACIQNHILVYVGMTTTSGYVAVFSSTGNLVRFVSIIMPVSNFKAGGFVELRNGRIMLYGGTSTALAAIISDNLFVSSSSVSFTPSTMTNYKIVMSDARDNLPVNNAGSPISISSNGRVFYTPNSITLATGDTSIKLYYSDTNGAGFVETSLTLRRAALYDGNKNSMSAIPAYYNDNLYIFVTGQYESIAGVGTFGNGATLSASNVYFTDIYKVNCTTLASTFVKTIRGQFSATNLFGSGDKILFNGAFKKVVGYTSQKTTANATVSSVAVYDGYASTWGSIFNLSTMEFEDFYNYIPSHGYGSVAPLYTAVTSDFVYFFYFINVTSNSAGIPVGQAIVSVPPYRDTIDLAPFGSMYAGLIPTLCFNLSDGFKTCASLQLPLNVPSGATSSIRIVGIELHDGFAFPTMVAPDIAYNWTACMYWMVNTRQKVLKTSPKHYFQLE